MLEYKLIEFKLIINLLCFNNVYGIIRTVKSVKYFDTLFDLRLLWVETYNAYYVFCEMEIRSHCGVER